MPSSITVETNNGLNWMSVLQVCCLHGWVCTQCVHITYVRAYTFGAVAHEKFKQNKSLAYKCIIRRKRQRRIRWFYNMSSSRIEAHLEVVFATLQQSLCCCFYLFCRQDTLVITTDNEKEVCLCLFKL